MSCTMSRHHKYYGPWSAFFQYCLERSRLSQNSLAEITGDPQQSINNYLIGRTRPPLDRIEAYAKALQLEGSEFANFLLLAHQAHTPELVLKRLEDLERKLALAERTAIELQAERATLVERLARLRTEVSQLHAKLPDDR